MYSHMTFHGQDADQVEMEAYKQVNTELVRKTKNATSILWQCFGFKLSNTKQRGTKNAK